MIINRLAVLLAQKKIKITQIAKDTGLSRTTLTTLSQNQSKRIDNETLNSLCNYLRITPDDFFEYTPLDFDVKVNIENITEKIDPNDGVNELSAVIQLILKINNYGRKVKTLQYSGKLTSFIENTEVLSSNVDFESEKTHQNNKNQYIKNASEIIKDSFLIPMVRKEIELVLTSTFVENLDEDVDINFSFDL